MKRFLTGIFFLLIAFESKAVIPFFPCDSVFVSLINANETYSRIEVTVWNTSISTFSTPRMTGVLAANPYLTIGTVPGQSAVLDYYGGPNNGLTGFALNCSQFTLAANVPTGTVFTGTVTLYNPNDVSVSCDYPVSFTYGTGPVGIANYLSLQIAPAFPNPANDFILLGENFTSENSNWKIYDCTGNLILESRSNKINLAEFAPGMYFFRNEERTGRFIKE